MKFHHWMITAFVGLASALAALGIQHRISDPREPASSTAAYPPTGLVRYANPAAPGPAAGPVDFTRAAALSTPAVVHVKTAYTTSARRPSGFDLFRDFFGDGGGSHGGIQRQSSGSGVVVSPDGHIVTNYHVIEQAERIEVILHDRRKLEADLVGTDPATDIALLKVAGGSAEKFPYVSIGDSDSVRVGEWVLAVGNPFELTSTVTAGIVSAKGRNINILRRSREAAVESFIQTDAAVNPGNSGGALVNTAGELIGINTAIATPTGTYAGYSFAVPSNIVGKVIVDLMEFGVVQRAYLGVMIDVNKDDLGGVYISEIIPGTASAESELKAGDVITRINGFEVATFPELQEQIAKYKPGDRVRVAYRRDDRDRTTMLTLKNAEKSTELVSVEDVEDAPVRILGARLEPLNDEERRRFEVDHGVRVSEVGSGPMAQRTGIRDGFIITSVNDRPVDNVGDLERRIKEAGRSAMIEGFYPDSPYKIYNYGLMLE